MQVSIMQGIQRIKKSLIALLLSGIIGFLSQLAIVQTAYAAPLSPEQELEEIQQDQAQENREDLYEAEANIIKDPKMGVQKQYEENLKEYKKENHEDNGVVEKVKDLLTPNSQ